MKRYGLALGIFLSAGAQALETLGRDELLSLCRSESPGGSLFAAAVSTVFSMALLPQTPVLSIAS